MEKLIRESGQETLPYASIRRTYHPTWTPKMQDEMDALREQEEEIDRIPPGKMSDEEKSERKKEAALKAGEAIAAIRRKKFEQLVVRCNGNMIEVWKLVRQGGDREPVTFKGPPSQK